MLDKFTFGNTPAAIYLVQELNRVNSSKLNRKVSSVLNNQNRLVKEVVGAFESGSLSLHGFGAIMNMLRDRVKNIKTEFENDLVTNLVSNMIAGNIKSILRRSTKVAQNNKMVDYGIKFIIPNGTPLSVIIKLNNAMKTIFYEKDCDKFNYTMDSITPETLIARSKQKLAKHGKECTYY